MNKYCQTPRLVVFIVYPEVKLLDVTGPFQVFSDAIDPISKTKAYNVKIVSVDGGLVPTDTSLPISTEPLKSVLEAEIDTLLVAGGVGSRRAFKDQILINNIKLLSENSSRTASVCTGAFLLAAAGLLNGKSATTHWDSCDLLADLFPEIHVESDPIFVRDENIWTSAGVTAGIDLALAMVGEDLGKKTALMLARRLVTYMVRPGGQSQFSEILNLQEKQPDERFEKLIEWIATNLDQDLSVERLADRANMSSRNFSRVFTKTLKQSPAKLVEAMRVDAVRRLLETTSNPIDLIGRTCGFRDDERMRRAFQRHLKTSPNEYRKRFTQQTLLEHSHIAKSA